MPELKTLETIYEEVIRRFQFESERTKSLDDKASNIMGFVGIITGLLSGLGAYVLKTTNHVAASLFVLALLLLILSFVYALAAYRVKKFTIVPDVYYLIGFYENKQKKRILRDLNDNYAVAIEENAKLNDQKAMDTKNAVDVLFIAIIMLLFFVISAYGFTN
jgi:hypothetical protein